MWHKNYYKIYAPIFLSGTFVATMEHFKGFSYKKKVRKEIFFWDFNNFFCNYAKNIKIVFKITIIYKRFNM